MRIVISDALGRKIDYNSIQIRMPRRFLKELPTYFFTNIILENITEREKQTSGTTMVRLNSSKEVQKNETINSNE